MKPKLLFMILALGLGGCAVSPENRPGRQAWDVRPVVDVRHGMAKAAAYYQLGAQSEKQGDMGTAERYYEQALPILRQVSDRTGEGRGGAGELASARGGAPAEGAGERSDVTETVSAQEHRSGASEGADECSGDANTRAARILAQRRGAGDRRWAALCQNPRRR